MFSVNSTPAIAAPALASNAIVSTVKVADISGKVIKALASTSENGLTVKEEAAAGNTILAWASSSANS